MLYDESTKRYRLHDLARLFADAKLSAEERAVGQKRFAVHYNDVLDTTDVLYLEGGESLFRGLALFDLEWANIQAGHAWVVAQAEAADKDVAWLRVTYPDAGLYILDLRQHLRDRIRWLEIALAEFRRVQHRKGEGATLGNLALAYANLGEVHRAILLHQQQLEIVRELGDRSGEGVALGNLGIVMLDLGESHLAIWFYKRCLAIAREVGDRRGEGYVRGNLGLAYAELGETRRAIKFYQQALLIYRELGDRRSEGRNLWNMSMMQYQLGKRAQAIQYAEQALTIFEQLDDSNAARVREQLAEWREQTNT